ncbi:uncharacterized protein A4U43_C02F17400 [Asparagus officinalis]|uniref:Uncharacterized protein n=1 Tax=Asparagus officinalis TaxID=4686 RepID=A0A5P1FMX9_ASPOF|nr:uncharacterized protein A4U43_C02F17400 [Asparagus officinalis]
MVLDVASFASQIELIIVIFLVLCNELHLCGDRYSNLSDLCFCEVRQFDLGDLHLNEDRLFGLGDLRLSGVCQLDPSNLLSENFSVVLKFAAFIVDFTHLVTICYSKTSVKHHNHYGHEGTREPKVMHTFDGSVPLFLKGSSEERIKGYRLGFVHEDAQVNEVFVVPNTFGNELAKTDTQYTNGDTRFPSWIRLIDTQWCTFLVNFVLITFEERLRTTIL